LIELQEVVSEESRMVPEALPIAVSLTRT